MRESVRQFVKSCKSCQTNKRSKHSYGKLPPKLVITTPWEALCLDLIGPYTIKGKDGSEIDFMCLTMIDPASSWFELVELPAVELYPTGSTFRESEVKHNQNQWEGPPSIIIYQLLDNTNN